MGSLTRAQIISQGMTMAGKTGTGLASVVGVEFDAWLKSTYKAWLWPFLCQQATISMPLGTTSQIVGNGNSSYTPMIEDVFDPIYLKTSDYRTRGEARIRNLRGNSPDTEPTLLDSTINRGMPTLFKVRKREAAADIGSVILIPYPVPDQSYILTLDVKILPATIFDSQYPRYENDRTLLQAAKVFTLQHMKLPEASEELTTLAAMVAQDFGKDGVSAGVNDNVGLDSRTFRR